MEFPESPVKLRYEEGTKKPCIKCKWQIANPTDPSKGQCTVSRTEAGAIWQRMIKDRWIKVNEEEKRLNERKIKIKKAYKKIENMEISTCI